ncbi:MAG: hypothetical protein ABIK78_06620 [candidate division WOR-3 bacterium]
MVKYIIISFISILLVTQVWANLDTTKLNEYNEGFKYGQIAARNEFRYQYRYCFSSTLGCCSGTIIPLSIYAISEGELLKGSALLLSTTILIPFVIYRYWDMPSSNVYKGKSEEYNDGYYDGYKYEFRKTKNKVLLTIIATQLASALIVTYIALTSSR